MLRILPFLIAIILLSINDGIAQNNNEIKIRGKVVEAATGQTIPGVNISFVDLQRGTASDASGTFHFERIPAGVYALNFSFIGYKERTITDILVRKNRTTDITVKLKKEVIEGQGVTVSAGYFNTGDTEIISYRLLNTEEIRRSPGGGQELSRVISSISGVASTGETSQDLMVRGGSPRENGFYIDNIYIPGIKHFEQMDGSSNGPIGLINTDLVKSLDFYAGGFSAKYGGKMSSMGEISYKEPNENRFTGSANMSLAGFGGTVEGPLPGQSGSWLVSVRRSYLDIISKAINAGGAPRYGDIQAKGVIDIDKNNELTLLQIYGDSKFTTEREDARNNGRLTYPTFENQQNTTGLNWRRLWNSKMYSNTAISYSSTTQTLNNRFTSSSKAQTQYDNHYQYLNFRSSTYWSISNTLRLEFGSDLLYSAGNFDYYYAPRTNESGVAQPAVVRNLQKSQWNAETFANLILKPVNNLTLNVGSRLGFYGVNNDISVSPRLSARWALNSRLSINASMGVYRQNLPLFLRSQQPNFDELSNPHANHYIAGFDYLINEATKLSIEAYQKDYRSLPIQPENYSGGLPHFVFDTNNFYNNLEDNGKAYARGIDVSIRKKIKNGIYGTINASLFRTRYKDFNDEWQNRDYDVKLLLSAIGGYRLNDKWEFSVRWTYIGNRPYTPIDKGVSASLDRTIREQNSYNDERLSPFHSIYLRTDRRFFWDNFTIVGFFELWNAYNRQNVEQLYWNRKTNSVDEINQFDLLPVGGFKIEF